MVGASLFARRGLLVVAALGLIGAACSNDAREAQPSAKPDASVVDAAGSRITVTEGDQAPIEMGAFSGCDGFRIELPKETVRGCAAVVESERPFAAVLHGAPADPQLAQLLVYKIQRDGDIDSALVVAGTEQLRVSPPGEGDPPDFFDVSVRDATVAGVPVIIVRYDPFSASAPPSEFDVIAWEEGADRPVVAVHAGGERGADLKVEADALILTHPDYSDGSPGCCPKVASVVTIRRASAGTWTKDVETVPIAQVTGEEPAAGD